MRDDLGLREAPIYAAATAEPTASSRRNRSDDKDLGFGREISVRESGEREKAGNVGKRPVREREQRAVRERERKQMSTDRAESKEAEREREKSGEREMPMRAVTGEAE
ncbi:hypothetical protein Scep_003694 [Stephania cephalantha]|uniref:Uncharacterized protein n=1 Tax=Stephania cephalantha TaxID=152367 RepID=A0AAP0PW02_9MAGN